MKVAYINISRSFVPNAEDLLLRQKHTMLYKQALSEQTEVFYLLRNSFAFDARVWGVTIVARDFSVQQFLWFILRYAAANKITFFIIHTLSHFMCVPLFNLFTR